MLTEEQLRLIRMYYYVHENKIYRGEFAPKETPKEEYCVGTVNHHELFIAQDLTPLREDLRTSNLISRVVIKIDNISHFKNFLHEHEIHYKQDISDKETKRQWQEISQALEDLI